MEELEKQINELSIKYTSETNKDYLKQFGQFFTLSTEILSNLTGGLKLPKKADILEPSAGTGTIILECMKHFKNFSLDAIEIDKNVYDKTKVLFEGYEALPPTTNFVNADFLKHDFKEKRYDLIIGNPPYFEITKEMRNSISDEFKEIISGRTNIYSLFIYKCIKLLKPKGQLVFIIPKTILSGKYFSKLRTFIHQNCNILDIIKFDNNKLFKKALQSVIILKLEKGEENLNLSLDSRTPPNDELEIRNKFIKIIDNELYFVKDPTQLSLNVDTTTIFKLNCTVKTGNIVWNQHKELLCDTLNVGEKSSLQLIHSSNFKEGNLVLNTVDPVLNNGTPKKQYMNITEQNKHLIITGPYILINRIVGLDPPKLNIYFQINNGEESKCFIENHVNFIKGPIEQLTRIYNSLRDPRTITFIKELIGNTQLSQHELENIIPIF
jgi:adenine-specific DNA-methyltransferase